MKNIRDSKEIKKKEVVERIAGVVDRVSQIDHK